MIIPQVCTTCNYNIGSIAIIWQTKVKKLIDSKSISDVNILQDEIDKSEIFKSLHVKGMCCRKTLYCSMTFPM